MKQGQTLERLEAGMPVITAGGQVIRVTEELAARFQPGDSLAVVAHSGELLRIPVAEKRLVTDAVTRCVAAFQAMGSVSDGQIAAFYEGFARALADDAIWSHIAEINAQDVADARARGRSTTRLVATEKMRKNMIDGLRGWMEAPSRRGQILETVQQKGFRVELVGAALGVVAFVFEGRPNVLADACGVLRGGNTVVFRIGSDALRTAQAIMRLTVEPALTASGLPSGAVTLIESTAHAAGWALFADERLALAVARGSGPAVATLGSLARSVGVPVSLHGTGGAWIVAAASVDTTTFSRVVVNSLDRKVCNTLNVCCILASETARLVPVLLDSLAEAGRRRGQNFKLHVAEGSAHVVPADLFQKIVAIRRAVGDVDEPQAELLPRHALGHEWEWEETPEITLVVVESVAEAVALFNQYSPLLVGSLLSNDDAEHQQFYETINAPFVGNDYTRWVDGQLALNKPELGLSNWQHGRLFGRGAILSGDSVYTVRTRYIRE
jgi:glutamate-5-semialdehyde dehydrogenase